MLALDLIVLAALCVSGAEPAAAAPSTATRVLVMDIEAVGVDAATAAAATRVVANAAAEVSGFQVMSTQDLRRMLDLEVERMSTGCTEESCLTEFADAMGAELVVFGSLSALGGKTTATLSLYSSSTQQVRRRIVEGVELSALQHQLRVETIALMKNRDPPSPAVLIAGAGLAVAGAATALGSEAVLQQPTTPNKDAWLTAGYVGLGAVAVGVVVAAVGAVILVLE